MIFLLLTISNINTTRGVSGVARPAKGITARRILKFDTARLIFDDILDCQNNILKIPNFLCIGPLKGGG